MSLVKRTYNDHKGEQSCKCKHRGTPQDYPDGILPEDYQRDYDITPEVETTTSTGRNVSDLSFGQLVFALETSLSDISKLKERVSILESKKCKCKD